MNYEQQNEKRTELRNKRKLVRDEIIEVIGEEEWKELLMRENVRQELMHLFQTVSSMQESRIVSIAVIKTLYPSVTAEEMEQLGGKRPSAVNNAVTELIKGLKVKDDILFKNNNGIRKKYDNYKRLLLDETVIKVRLNTSAGAATATYGNGQVQFNKQNHETENKGK